MEQGEGPKERAARPGDAVGLGTVVDNPARLGRLRTPANPGETPPDEPLADEPLVDEASEESFPASDPPGSGSSGRPGIGAIDRPSA